MFKKKIRLKGRDYNYIPIVLSSAGTCFRSWFSCLFPRGNFPTFSEALAGGLFNVCNNKSINYKFRKFIFALFTSHVFGCVDLSVSPI